MLNGFHCLSKASRHVYHKPILSNTQIASNLWWKPRYIFKRNLQTQQFSAFTPPDPATLAKPKIKKPKRRRPWLRRTGVVLLVGLPIAFVIDRYGYASSIARSLRTFWTGLVIGVDYKVNFRAHPPFARSLEDVHRRSAERIFHLLRDNGGLYLKIGQAIAMQSAVLPPEFQKMFSRMFDDAPQNSWADVERVVREDFGKSVEEVFGVSFSGDTTKGIMERTARASASVAQVHWARLPDGREVAIKIQKREIAAQVGWDLWAFKVVARVYSWWFDLPVYTLVPYISERLMLETDFENEANNSTEMKAFVDGEKRLRGKVYIPQVYRELSSKRVMTAEWIEGIRLWDKEGIETSWYGGYGKGTPGAGHVPLDDAAPSSAVAKIPTNDPNHEKLKPERNAWRGQTGKGGLGLNYKPVMQIMVDLFSAQMFLWGLVHCDPHPGNIFIRRLPNGKPELVLIDHGLYIRMSPEFKHQYARFWKALISFDNDTIKEVVNSWGVSNPDIFASATLLKPYTGGDNSTSNALAKELEGKDEQERAFEMQMRMRKGIRQILGDESKWPRELIFIGRNLRIVQGNNQFLGSPVNRIKITGLWASRALAEDKALSFTERFRNLGSHFVFRVVLLGTDIVWWWFRLRQIAGFGRGMDDEIEQQMKKMAKDFGVELQHDVFDG
jgi:aarF domain-containing kinase